MEFDSAALGGPSTALVWLPQGYSPTGPAWPVAYFLHGEVLAGGPDVATQLAGLALGELERGFILVAPDAGAETACATCVWIDGTVGAEAYLDEVIAVVEDRFNARGDRAGRAVLGTSMGGTGALIQGFHHPDRYAFVGSLSPLLDLAGAPSVYDAYLTGQGLRPRGVGEIDWRNVSPLDLAPQVAAANVETVIIGLEADAGANTGPAAVMAELGIPHTYLINEGERFSSDGDVLRTHILHRLHTTFEHPLPAPHRFSYKSTDRAFDVWGYSFAVQRSNVEFLNVLGARLDGRDFILAGTGTVTVTTPPEVFPPGSQQDVVLTPDPRSEDAREAGQKLAPLRPTRHLVVADADGRVTFPVPLQPARVHDEQEALVYTGNFEMPHVRVEIPAVDDAPPHQHGAAPASLWRDDLPAPYDQWNVQVTPWEENAQVLTVDFDSPALELRTRSYVYLPDAYLDDSAPLPVAYFLHGTVDPPGGSGKWQSLNMGFHRPELLARQQYVVVSPDMGEISWCHKCWWMDALEPARGNIPWRLPYEPVKGETHLYDELVPLVEEMFRVRTDRAGRGILGNSMGATGAAHQALRHPDRFAFAGILSGMLDWGSEYHDPGLQLSAGYFARQGYPNRLEGEIWYRNISPLDLGPQATSADLEILASIGDGCINFLSSDDHCTHAVDYYPPVAEFATRRDNDHVSPLWTELGVAHTLGRYHGVHYWPDGDVYESWYLDRINAKFAQGTTDPFRFSYKNAFPAFSIWGYDVEVERPNTEFLNILGAQLDGRSFTLAGTGVATVTTPAGFQPHRRYDVRLTDDAGDQHTIVATADAHGRLSLQVPLGAARTIDERRELVEAGQFPMPHTRVDVAAGPPGIGLLQPSSH